MNALKRGTGEPYLILKRHGEIDFSPQIIKCATKCLAFDPQCEGSRAEYIYGLIKQSAKKDEIIDAILTTLVTAKNDYWSLQQMCELCVVLHRNGCPEAKAALYERYE